MQNIISIGNEEVDRQLGGGLPVPSLVLIEGDHGSGKSVVAAQFMYGLLNAGMRILLISENSVKQYINKMKTIQYNFALPFLQNKLVILPLYVYGVKWSEEQSKFLLPVLSKYISINSEKFDVITIDSLSLLTMYSSNESILDFITRCKYMVSNGKTVILTIHPKVLLDDIASRLRGACDCYIKLSSVSIAGRDVKSMEIVKLIGAKGRVSNFAFEVDPSFGIKIVPIAMANA
ncbi:MAG: flagellar accessory protein FlaH [Candidatus Nitrosocaldaceae archaeon]|nr:MAG: flagellar accessory protein FlaH [Candidatus Nitrosocaldaceae archaeon]